MSWLKTLIVFIIFAILAGGYYLSSKKQAEKTEREEIASRLVTPEQDALTGLSIRNADTSIELVKEDDTWHITEPVEARADQAAVRSLLSTIDSTKKTDPFAATDLAEYGLQQPAMTAEVRAAADNYIETVAIGSTSPSGNEIYVRLGEGDVFTAPTSLQSALTKSVAELRDKRTVPADLNQATSLSLSSDNGAYRLEKTTDTWVIATPLRAPADQEKVLEILREWNNARVADWIDPATTTGTVNAAAYGLADPIWQATAYVAGIDPRTSPTAMTLLIGDANTTNPSRRWAKMEGDASLFTVEATLTDKLSPTLLDLRSKAIYSTSAADAGHVVFDVHGSELALTRDSAGLWRLADEPAVDLDQAVVSGKIRDLAGLKATRIIEGETTPSVTGLDQPNLRITLSNQAGTTTETLITGRKDETDDIVYAQRTDTGVTYALDWQEPGKFFITRNELIDKHLFDFSEDLVGKVEVHESTRTLTFERQASGGWTVSAADSDAEGQVQAATMSGLLYSLMSLEWKRPLDPQIGEDQALIELNNLQSPPRRVVFYDDEGDAVANLGIGGEDERNAYVSTAEARFYAVDKARLAPISSALRSVLDEAAAGD